MPSDVPAIKHVKTLQYGKSIITSMRSTFNGFCFFTRNGDGFQVQGSDAHQVISLPQDHIFHSAWDSYGIHLATAVRGAVEIHDTLSRSIALVLPIRGIRTPSRIAWSPFDHFIAVGARSVRVFDTATGDEVIRFPSHPAGIQGLSWSPDSTWIASGDEWGHVRLNELSTGQSLELPNVGGAGIWTGPEWSPCGRYLAMKSPEMGVQIFDLTSQQIVATIKSKPRFCAFNKVGHHAPPEEESLFLTKDTQNVQLWSTLNWTLVATIPAKASNYVLTESAFGWSGDTLATLEDRDTTIHFWNIKSSISSETFEGVPDPGTPSVKIHNWPTPETSSARSKRIAALADDSKNAKTAAEKGKTLEILMDSLLSSIPGWNVASRPRNQSEEFDLTILNRCGTKPFSDWGELLIVECKNRKEKCGAPDIRALIGKMGARRGGCKTAFLVSRTGFSSGIVGSS